MLRRALGAALVSSSFLAAAVALAHTVVAPVAQQTPMPKIGATEPAPAAVHVTLTVDGHGHVIAASVDDALSPALERRVLDAVSTWHFAPATVDGAPHSARIRVEVTFERAVDESPNGEPSVPHADGHGHGSVEDHPDSLARSGTSSKARRGEPITVVVRGAARPLSAGQITRDRRQLGAAPHKTGSDLLRTLPGMFLTQHSGDGKAHQVFFRGFDAVHGQDLEVTVAGAPVNEVSNVHGQGYADLHFVIPETVLELELLPGPFDPEQGDFAIAGSARYRLGYPHQGVSALAGLGSWGARRGLIAMRPEQHTESNFAAVELYDSDGFGVRRASRRLSALSQFTGHSGELAWRGMGGYYAGSFESPGVLRLDDVQSGQVGRYDSYDLHQGGHSSRAQLVAELEHAAGEVLTRITPYLVVRSLDLSHNYTGALQHPVTDLTTQRNTATTAGFTASHERRLALTSKQDTLRLGTTLRRDSIEQSQVLGDEPTSVVDASVTATQLGAWFGLELHGIPRSVVRPGVRADALWFHTVDHLAQVRRGADGLNLAPKLSLDVAVAPGWHVLAAFAQGFRSPQARSLGDGEQTPFTRVTALDLGLRYSPGRWFNASISGFSSWLEDDLVFDETTSRNSSAPSSWRSGIAWDFVTRAERLLSTCGGTLTQAVFTGSDERFVSGQLVPYVPRLVARCDAAYSAPVAAVGQQNLLLGAGGAPHLVWRRPLPYAEEDPGFFLVDASAWLRWGSLELRADVENLLNAAWTDGEFVYASHFEPGSTSGLPRRHVTIGAPRTWMFTLSVLGLR